MAELKTKPTERSVDDFLRKLPPDRRKDADAILAIMQTATKEKPVMWGTTIVGFGKLHYKYASGREGDWFKAGFSPRKDAFTLYLCGGFEPHAELLERLGKFKTGVGCLYVKKLDDVDQDVLKQLVSRMTTAAKTFVPGA